MSNTKTKKRANATEATEMREDLQNKIEQTREAIRNAIMKGDSTVKLRQFLAEQEQTLAKLNAQEQAQEQAKRDAQVAAQRADAQRHASDAAQLAAARQARISCLSDRFRIPDVRSSFA